jgi:hypothetical protein
MSAFAVLQGAEDGDFDRLVQKKKSQLAKESAKREAEAAASRAAFDDLKAKAGQSNWADDDEEDDDFYSLPPVPTSRLPLAPGLNSPANGAASPEEEEEDDDDDDEDDKEEDDEEDVPAAAAPAGAPLTEPKRGKKPKNGKVQAELEEVDSLLAELENSDSGKNVEAGGLSKAAAKRAKKKAKEAGAVADVPAAAAAAAAAAEPEGRNGAGEDADESPGAAADETAGKSAEEIKAMIKAKAAAAAKKKSSGAKGVAASAQQAAAAAAKERANAKKKKNDKSHYNQTPG